MKNLQEVFKNIDSKLFESEEVQKSLQEAFESSVNEQAENKAKKLFEDKEDVYQKSLDEMLDTIKKSIQLDTKEQFNESVIAQVKELVEEYGSKLDEETKEQYETEVEKLKEDTLKLVEVAIKEFKQEAIPSWEKEVNEAKSKAIVEEMTQLAETFNIKISKLDESKEVTGLQESFDKALEREKALEEKVQDLTKKALIKESKKDLTSVQADKLDNLLEGTEFVNESDYKEKIERFKTILGGVSNTNITETHTQGSSSASWKK